MNDSTRPNDLEERRNGAQYVAELSSLGDELDNDNGTLNNFGLLTTALPTAATSEVLYTGRDREADMPADMHKVLFPHEVRRLVEEATSNTERLSAFFTVTDLMEHETRMETHATACALMCTCLRAFPAIACPPDADSDTYYVPPPESAWSTKRRGLEESLLRNLRKYVRFSEHFIRRPPRSEEKFHDELNKLHAFADKFFDLSSKLSASNDKLRLMELVENYERIKLERLVKREQRATVRADRAARKLERELLRQQRDSQRANTVA